MDGETVVLQLEAGGASAVLTVKDELTIWKAAEIRRALLEALDRADRVELDLAAVAEADVAALQLLCAAHRSAAGQGKTLVVRRAAPALAEHVKASGFARHQGCAEGCLWIEGGA
jgi:anti-anti-sigma regulatory factor